MITRGFQESYSLEPDCRRDPSQRIKATISPRRQLDESEQTQTSQHFKTIQGKYQEPLIGEQRRQPLPGPGYDPAGQLRSSHQGRPHNGHHANS